MPYLSYLPIFHAFFMQKCLEIGCRNLKSRYFRIFFQAEDGIRDAQESRGLGDVYKRQLVYFFRYGIGIFARINYFGPKNSKKGVKSALLSDILVDKAYLVTFES